MENAMMGTRNVLVLLAVIVALFILVSLLGGEEFSRSVMNVTTTINMLLLGLLVLVLAQVFDMGVRLQADNDLTV